MAISHAGHDHPATPAGRAACRKAMAAAGIEATTPTKGAMRNLAEKAGVVKMTVTPRGPKGGVVNKLKEGKPSTKNLKKPNTQIRTVGDLPDVPRMLAYGVRLAWANEWPVRVGDQFNDTEARIVIDAPAGEIALVWKPSMPDGVWGVFFRPGYNSVTNRIGDIQTAFALGNGEPQD